MLLSRVVDDIGQHLRSPQVPTISVTEPSKENEVNAPVLLSVPHDRFFVWTLRSAWMTHRDQTVDRLVVGIEEFHFTKSGHGFSFPFG